MANDETQREGDEEPRKRVRTRAPNDEEEDVAPSNGVEVSHTTSPKKDASSASPVKDGRDCTTKLLVPARVVGSIIGSGGLVIKKLREESGSRINISDTLPGYPDRVVAISGTVDQVRKAFEHVVRFATAGAAAIASGSPFHTDPSNMKPSVDEEAPLEYRILVPTGKAGGLIGRGGEVINGLRNRSGCHIQISQPDPNEIDREAALKGTLSAIVKAHNEIVVKLLDVVDRSQYAVAAAHSGQNFGGMRGRNSMPIANNANGVQSVQRMHRNVMPQQNRLPMQGADSNFGARGGMNAVGNMGIGMNGGSFDRRSMGGSMGGASMGGMGGASISGAGMARATSFGNGGMGVGNGSTIANGGMSMSGGGMGGGGMGGGIGSSMGGNRMGGGMGNSMDSTMGSNSMSGGMIGMSAGRQSAGVMNASQLSADIGLMQSTQVQVPDESMGKIIGKQGSSINEIRQLSGARIEIGASDGSQMRLITLLGTPEQMQLAQYMLSMRMSGGRPSDLISRNSGFQRAAY